MTSPFAKNSDNNKLSVKFVEAMVRFIFKYNAPSTITVTGYTVCKLELDGRPEIFCVTSNYGDDGEWYDWCLIEWEDHEETYPGHILGFFEYYVPGIHSKIIEGLRYLPLCSCHNQLLSNVHEQNE